MDVETLAAIVVDCGLHIHRRIGPGLLESAYEIVLANALERRGLMVERQKLVAIQIDGLVIDAGFRADILVENSLLIELKSIDRLAPVHGKQLLTYLRFLDLPVGLLMNFGGETFKGGSQADRQQSRQAGKLAPPNRSEDPLTLRALISFASFA